MAKRVGIVSVTYGPFIECDDWSHPSEIVFKQVEKVRADTGLAFAKDRTGIDATVTNICDMTVGNYIPVEFAADVAGAHLREEVTVTTEGAMAVFYAVAKILTGMYDVVLLTSYNAGSKTNEHIVENWGFEGIFQQKLGLDDLQAGALQETRYMHKYGITREQCAQVVVKNRLNGLKNPLVPFGTKLSVSDVLKSPMMAYPITSQEMGAACDGACTMILASEEKAKKLTNKPVWITGMAQCDDSHSLGGRELAELAVLEKVAQQAYKMAGVSNPQKDLNLIELSEHYAYQELMCTEALGLCKPGEGGKLIATNATQRTGKMPVNPSGGVLSGNPKSVAGAVRVAECVMQLRGEAGERQIDGARRALAHGSAGPAGQAQCAIILEKGF